MFVIGVSIDVYIYRIEKKIIRSLTKCVEIQTHKFIGRKNMIELYGTKYKWHTKTLTLK